MRQTTIFEPQDETALLVAIERLGWHQLPDEYGMTVWRRNGIEREVAPDDLAAWLAAGTPEKPEPTVFDVQQAIDVLGPVTKRRLKEALKPLYDLSSLDAILAEMLAEMLADGWIEETAAGFVGVDRI